MNQPWIHNTLLSRARKVFAVQLYRNNAPALPSRILSIVDPNWLQHARTVRGVNESLLKAEPEIAWII